MDGGCTASRALRSDGSSARLAGTLRLLLRRFRDGLLLVSRAREDVAEAVIAFVARELVDRSLGLHDRIGDGPRSRPGRRIIQREAVLDRLGVDARQPLSYMKVRAGTPDGGSV